MSFTLVCLGDQHLEVALTGAGVFDYGDNGEYSCGESWTETYGYQSYNSSFVVFYAAEDGLQGYSEYQVLAVVIDS